MRIVAIRHGAIAESHKLKPEISFWGVGGRPIEDEVELELLLMADEGCFCKMSHRCCSDAFRAGCRQPGNWAAWDSIVVTSPTAR